MYGKIFTDIFDSSLIAVGGWLPTYVFMSMIALADKDGLVQIAPKALYRRLGFREFDSKIAYEDFQAACEYLETPDSESRSPVHEGRRIIPLAEINEFDSNRGWFIVNYEQYRRKASKAEPPGSSTERVRRFRERKNYDLAKCNGNETVCNDSIENRNGHTDTDTDKRKEGAERPWDQAVVKGVSRKYLGKLAKVHGTDMVDHAVIRMLEADPADPASYIQAILKNMVEPDLMDGVI